MKRGDLKLQTWVMAGLLVFPLLCSFTSTRVARAFPQEPDRRGYTLKQDRVAARKPSGKFKVVYAPVKTPTYQKLKDALAKEQGLEQWAGELNRTYSLPTNILITVAECGAANAFYQPSKRQIVLCYELIELFVSQFSTHFEPDAEIVDAVFGATNFVLYHELGHALIDVFNLPITGREEDAADQFATIMLIMAGEQGSKSIIAAALSFHLGHSEEAQKQELTFWNRHSLNAQRVNEMMCLLYGSSPSQYAKLAQQLKIPKDRVLSCPSEYLQARNSWAQLLEPHLR